MTCTDHQRTINRFIDHEVRATESAEMFEHLAKCAECRRFYDTIKTLGAELDKVHPSTDEAVEAPWRPGRQPVYRLDHEKRIAPRPSTVAFVVVVLLVVSLLFSVNVTIEKPAPIMPSASTSQR